MALSKVQLATALALVPTVLAHNHGVSHIMEGHTISADPLDTTIWIHIMLQTASWGIIFPLGMVLGMVKSRWHVPVQVVGTIIAILAYFLGHLHGGREFVHNNVHAKFATPLSFLLFLQIAFGVYLKLHLERGINARIRPWIKTGHGIAGKTLPVLAWTQMLFGGITALGFCQGEHVGQCAAHFIMGSAFIGYGILLTILLVVGQQWLKRTGRSQEFFDSAVIAAWGCVNTFTEHRWGTEWGRGDWQHTTMGIVWWCAGLAGVWLSRDRDGNPQRNFIPGFVLLITGWAMSAHQQELMVSAETHKIFGYTLMGAGLSRVIEVAFVVKDRVGMSEDGRVINSFQFVPVFLLYAAGFLFMGATEEQMSLVASSGMDHVAYILITFSLAFLMFLFANMLVTLYDRSTSTAIIKLGGSGAGASNGHATGGAAGANGHAALRDAQEFELEGLMSEDDEDEDDAENGKTRRGKGTREADL